MFSLVKINFQNLVISYYTRQMIIMTSESFHIHNLYVRTD